MSRRSAPAPVPAYATGRRHIAVALARSTVRERLVLALLLAERLTPREVAGALDCPVAEVERTYQTWIGALRGALRSRTGRRASRAVAREALAIESGVRKAS